MENKETKKQISGILQFLMWFVIIWEGIKWFHNKFGIIGDMILMVIFIYIAFSQPEKKYETNKDKPMWKNHWSNKK